MVNCSRRHVIRTTSSALVALSGCAKTSRTSDSNPDSESLPEIEMINETDEKIEVGFQVVQLPSNTKQANQDISIDPGNTYRISELENGEYIIQISTFGTTTSHQFSIDDAHSLQVYIKNHGIKFRMLAT